jgi:predicted RNA-binding Zn ribbon-like protein
MTVKSQPPPASRAGAIALVAGDLALDLANTESGSGGAAHQDHLQQPGHVADWLEHAGVLDASGTKTLRARLAAEPRLGATLLEQARRLRDDIQRIGAALAHRSPPAQAALDDLAARCARWLALARLVPDGERRSWRWRLDDTPIAAALGPVTLAAVALVTERDPARVKECRGVACGWLFYDETKNNRRRWCEMAVCGNRAKQRRRAARRREA